MNPKLSKEEYLKKNKKNIFLRFFLRSIDILAQFTLIPKLRIFFYRLIGVKIGKNCFISLYCHLDTQFAELITLEDGVGLGPGTTILCHDDSNGWYERKKDGLNCIVSAVTIKKGTFIGANALILPGVIIGEGCIISSGSVISTDIPDFYIVLRESNNYLKRKDI